MKEIKREKIRKIKVYPGDSIVLSYRKEVKDRAGKVLGQNLIEVLKAKIEERSNFDEAVIFEVEKGDFGKAKRGIGGALFESDKK